METWCRRFSRVLSLATIGIGCSKAGPTPGPAPAGAGNTRAPAVLLGFTEAELEPLCSGNVLRVWQSVLDHAATARPRG